MIPSFTGHFSRKDNKIGIKTKNYINLGYKLK